MKQLALALIPFLAASLLASTTQKPAQSEPPREFPVLIEEARSAWTAGEYGQCLARLREATARCTVRHTRAILDALPAAPEGYEVVVDPALEQPASGLLRGRRAASPGNAVRREYRGPVALNVTVTANSPLVRMFNVWVSHPDLLEEGSRVIDYGAHQAVLKTTRDGQARELLILLHGVHTCQVTFEGTSADLLLALFDQAAVDELARVLGH